MNRFLQAKQLNVNDSLTWEAEYQGKEVLVSWQMIESDGKKLLICYIEEPHHKDCISTFIKQKFYKDLK